MRWMIVAIGWCWLAGAACGADAPVLRYRFTPDQELVYQTSTELLGTVTFTPDQGQAQQLPLKMTVDDTVHYRVSVVKPDGAAWVAVELTALTVKGKMFDTEMNLEMADIGELIMINLGPRNWMVERPGDGPTPQPEEIGLGFTTADAAAMFGPMKMLLAPTGEILEKEGRSWQDQLARANPIGAWLPILRPFGDGLPQVPGRAVDPGQTWHQERELSLPMAEKTFPMQLDFQLAEPQPEQVGVPVSYAGSLQMADIAMQIEPMPGLQIPLKLGKLDHLLSGTAFYDVEAGALTRQELTSKVTSSGRGEMQPGFTLDSNIEIRSTRQLSDSQAPIAAPDAKG